MTIDDGICENCLAKNHCDVLPYSNNCNEIRAMKKYDKQVYNKAIDDFVKEICKMIVQSENNGNYRFYAVEIKQAIADLAEQLKAGGENDK